MRRLVFKLKGEWTVVDLFYLNKPIKPTKRRGVEVSIEYDTGWGEEPYVLFWVGPEGIRMAELSQSDIDSAEKDLIEKTLNEVVDRYLKGDRSTSE